MELHVVTFCLDNGIADVNAAEMLMSLSGIDNIEEHNLAQCTELRASDTYSVCLHHADKHKCCAVVISHRHNIFHQKLSTDRPLEATPNSSHHNNYMVYMPRPTTSATHYVAIYSSDVYTVSHQAPAAVAAYAVCLDNLRIYVHIYYPAAVLCTLLAFTLLVASAIAFWSTCLAAVFGVLLQRWNQSNVIIACQKAASMLIILLCIASYLVDGVLLDLSCDKLLRLTALQRVIFVLVITSYSFELAVFRVDFKTLLHHILGWLGIACFSSLDMAGGVITLWLADVVTTVLVYFGVNFHHLLYWAVFVFVRIIWYNYVSYRCMQCVRTHDQHNALFTYCLLVWWIFANVFHAAILKDNRNDVRCCCNSKWPAFTRQNALSCLSAMVLLMPSNFAALFLVDADMLSQKIYSNTVFEIMRMTLKKERKLREIKNGPIDFNVTVPPGAHFRDWRPFAVQKLQVSIRSLCEFAEWIKQRLVLITRNENRFSTRKRFTVYRRIIEQYQKSSGDEHHFVDFDSILDGIRRDFTTAMHHDISDWKSPAHIAAPKRGHLIFRDYFQSCRNSWDQRKVKLLCDYLFLAMLEQAQRIFGGQSICFYSTFQAMLEATIQIPNSMDKLMMPKAVCVLLNQQHHELMPMHTVSRTAHRKHETNKRGSRTREHMLQCLSDKLLSCSSSASQTEAGLPPEIDNNAANQERAVDAFMSLSNDVGYDFEHCQQAQPPLPVPGRHHNDHENPRTFADVQPPTLHSSNISTRNESGNAYNEETRRVWDGPEFVNDISIQGSMPSHPMRIGAHYYTPYNIDRRECEQPQTVLRAYGAQRGGQSSVGERVRYTPY